MAQMGLARLNFAAEIELTELRKLLNSLEKMILEMIQALEVIHEDSAYKLHCLNESYAGSIERMAKEQAAGIEAEIAKLEIDSEKLRLEIVEITRNSNARI